MLPDKGQHPCCYATLPLPVAGCELDFIIFELVREFISFA